ncbi:hypothetical protein HAX54_016610 [Datura stramonium]|uniref:Uncharacterized protein n=1 Tax=Datura stramonium TaxID=4076 RepID=A0ABS8ULG1_DATST|nr:hypothetical protein [Datura stramonium]
MELCLVILFAEERRELFSHVWITYKLGVGKQPLQVGHGITFSDTPRHFMSCYVNLVACLTGLLASEARKAVQMLLASRKSMKEEKAMGSNVGTKKSEVKSKAEVDPIQVDLLLGKAYSEWGRVSDAVSVYNQLISMYPDDFRGYLAKGIILKENGNVGDAERMFIQARFFAPGNAKMLVDKYSK